MRRLYLGNGERYLRKGIERILGTTDYRGITLVNVVEKVYCKVLNNRSVQCLDKEGFLYEDQVGFRVDGG